MSRWVVVEEGWSLTDIMNRLSSVQLSLFLCDNCNFWMNEWITWIIVVGALHMFDVPLNLFFNVWLYPLQSACGDQWYIGISVGPSSTWNEGRQYIRLWVHDRLVNYWESFSKIEVLSQVPNECCSCGNRFELFLHLSLSLFHTHTHIYIWKKINKD